MSYWDELGIEATPDKKLIKKAYAKRLKVTRPEEDAEAFQHLYKAYQRALSYADYRQEYDTTEDDYEDEDAKLKPEVEEIESVSESDLEPSSTIVVSDPPLSTTTSESELASSLNQPVIHTLPSVEEHLEQEWLRTEDWLDQLLADPQEANRLLNWGFLKRSPLLQDLEWRTRVSTYVFEKVASANYDSLNNTDLPAHTLYIKSHILNYLARLLDWETSWQYLRGFSSEAYLDAVFSYLTLNNTQEQTESPAVEIPVDRGLSFFKWVIQTIRALIAIYINVVVAVLLMGASLAISFYVAMGLVVFIFYTYYSGGRFIKWVALGHTIMGLKYGKQNE